MCMYGYCCFFAENTSYDLAEELYLSTWYYLAVKLNANRMIVGTLRGFDQFMNLVVDNTVEVNGNEKNDIGMVVSPHTMHYQVIILVVYL